jgi:predicted anti-sigma-YlaC factor YlaD
MPEYNVVEQMHRDAWWERVMAGTLTLEEQQAWEEHLVRCEECQASWAAVESLDALFAVSPPPPPPPDFTSATVERLDRERRRRRVWQWLGGIFVVLVILVVEVAVFGTAFWRIARATDIFLSSRDLICQALMRVWLGFISMGDTLLPMALLVVAISLFFLMPNGILTTLALVLLRRRHASTVRSRS